MGAKYPQKPPEGSGPLKYSSPAPPPKRDPPQVVHHHHYGDCSTEGTHHEACACREARFKRMEELLREVSTVWSGEVKLPLRYMLLWMKLTKQIEEVLREG